MLVKTLLLRSSLSLSKGTVKYDITKQKLVSELKDK